MKAKTEKMNIEAEYEALRVKVGGIAAELKQLAIELDKCYYNEDADAYSG